MGFQKLIKDKRGLEFKSAFFAVIAVSLVIAAVGTIIGDWNTTYNSGLSYDLQEYDKTSEMSSEVQNQKDAISPSSAETGSGDFEGSILRGVFGVISDLYRPFNIVFGEGGMLDSVTEQFGIPDYVRQGLVAMMVAAITFTLIAILFRMPRSSA